MNFFDYYIIITVKHIPLKYKIIYKNIEPSVVFSNSIDVYRIKYSSQKIRCSFSFKPIRAINDMKSIIETIKYLIKKDLYFNNNGVFPAVPTIISTGELEQFDYIYDDNQTTNKIQKENKSPKGTRIFYLFITVLLILFLYISGLLMERRIYNLKTDDSNRYCNTNNIELINKNIVEDDTK